MHRCGVSRVCALLKLKLELFWACGMTLDPLVQAFSLQTLPAWLAPVSPVALEGWGQEAGQWRASCDRAKGPWPGGRAGREAAGPLSSPPSALSQPGLESVPFPVFPRHTHPWFGILTTQCQGFLSAGLKYVSTNTGKHLCLKLMNFQKVVELTLQEIRSSQKIKLESKWQGSQASQWVMRFLNPTPGRVHYFVLFR